MFNIGDNIRENRSTEPHRSARKGPRPQDVSPAYCQNATRNIPAHKSRSARDVYGDLFPPNIKRNFPNIHSSCCSFIENYRIYDGTRHRAVISGGGGGSAPCNTSGRVDLFPTDIYYSQLSFRN